MKRKCLLILTAALFLSFCLAGCNSGSADSSGQENISSSAETEADEELSSESETSAGENSDEGNSAPVFDLESRTVTLNSGYEMPVAGLGTYALSDEECYNSVTALLECGGRLIDTASYYAMRKVSAGQSETVMCPGRRSSSPQRSIPQNLTTQREPSKPVLSVWISGTSI